MKPKLLYVEDEPFLAKVVKETLEHLDFDVVLVSDGAKVVRAFEQFKPDICILDVMLPHIDGFALGRILKSKQPDLPLIFLTAKSFTEDVVMGFEAGGTDYIRKPFSMEELIARINNQLRLKQTGLSKNEDPKELPIGSFCFSPERMELRGPKETTQLSHRETQVLSLLVANRNKTTDRKELLLTVWGDDSFFNSRTLDVYIRKLRTYFSADPSIAIITLKGKGYLFNA
jgi:DNA-binding response OmpR family regulator